MAGIFETLEEWKEIKINETSTLKFNIVKTNRGLFLDIRKFVSSEGYTGPTKQGIMFDRALLNKLISEDVFMEAIAKIDKIEGGDKKTKTKKSTKK